MARDEVVSGADRDGDGFAFQVADGFELRPRDQGMERSSQRQAYQPHGRAGNSAARNRAGAEGIVDLAGLNRADSERRAHGDDLGVDPMFTVKAAFFGRPCVQKAERLGRYRDADFFQSALRRHARSCRCEKKR